MNKFLDGDDEICVRLTEHGGWRCDAISHLPATSLLLATSKSCSTYVRHLRRRRTVLRQQSIRTPTFSRLQVNFRIQNTISTILNEEIITFLNRFQATALPEYRVNSPVIASDKTVLAHQLEPSFEKTPDNIRVAQPIYFSGLSSIISSVVNNSKLSNHIFSKYKRIINLNILLSVLTATTTSTTTVTAYVISFSNLCRLNQLSNLCIFLPTDFDFDVVFLHGQYNCHFAWQLLSIGNHHLRCFRLIFFLNLIQLKLNTQIYNHQPLKVPLFIIAIS